jgi:hypothetical protein
MRPSNPPANVTLFKNLESVAKAPQLLGARNGFGLAQHRLRTLELLAAISSA